MPLHYEGPPDLLGFFEDLCNSSLSAVSAEHMELSVTLCDDTVIRPLNSEWRGADKATDVLSFPQLEMSPGDPLPQPAPDGPPTSLGDIVISTETA